MKKIAALLFCCLIAPPFSSAFAKGVNESMPDAVRAIETVLAAYTRSVAERDQTMFESLLLDPDIPFHGLSNGTFSTQPVTGLAAVQSYAGFRKAVFQGKDKLAQRFFDIKIVQEGDLAQVSLRFETVVVASGTGARGWKALTLLRVAGHWKIASEFYTAYAMDTRASPAR